MRMEHLIPSPVRKKVPSSSSYDSSFELLPTYNPDITSPKSPSRSRSSSLLPRYNAHSSSASNLDSKPTTEGDTRRSSSSSQPPPDLPPTLPPRQYLSPKPLPPISLWIFWRTHILVFAVFGTIFGLLIWGATAISPLLNSGQTFCDTNATATILDPNYIIKSDLNFAQAKMIDVAWDFGIGQGGRIIMGWVTYIVAKDALVKIMEEGRVGYEVYMTVAFEMPSVWSGWVVLKSLVMGWENWTHGGWRMKIKAKVVLGLLLVCVIWVLWFPTFSGAATSYTALKMEYWTMPNGDMVTSFKNVTQCAVVKDGRRIGLKDGEVVQGPPVNYTFPQETLISLVDSIGTLNGTTGVFSYPSDTWYTMYLPIPLESEWAHYGALWNYTMKFTVKDNFRTWYLYRQQVLTGGIDGYFDPRLLDDIKASVNLELIYPSNITIDRKSYTLPAPALDIDILFQYCYQSKVLPSNWQDVLGSCVKKQTAFEWGFSSVLLWALLGGQALWILVLYCIYLDANLYSVLLRHGRNARGNLRSVADLAEALQEDLGPSACGYSERELAKSIRGRGVRFFVDDRGPGRVSHVGVSSRRLEPVILRRQRVYGAKQKWD